MRYTFLMSENLSQRAKAGDVDAVAILFESHRQRLRRMIEVRMDHRLAGRIDPSDILQETFIDAQNKIDEFKENTFSFFLWIRLKLGDRLIALHRFHLGAKKRTVHREQNKFANRIPEASSESILSCLAKDQTTASQAAIRSEALLQIKDSLNQMDQIDREVLVMRHFEDLTNAEVAQILSISPNAASNRYVRALGRLKTFFAKD